MTSNTRSKMEAEIEPGTVRLTRREKEMLAAFAEGLSAPEIAARLFVTPRTVHFHAANIYAKLEVTNRMQALRAAERLGLLG
jgi:DNA-binding NarL/FixJ family response regulator